MTPINLYQTEVVPRNLWENNTPADIVSIRIQHYLSSYEDKLGQQIEDEVIKEVISEVSTNIHIY